MDEMIKTAIKALEDSNCNEVEITDITGLKVRVVKFSPTTSWYPGPWQYTITYPAQQY